MRKWTGLAILCAIVVIWTSTSRSNDSTVSNPLLDRITVLEKQVSDLISRVTVLEGKKSADKPLLQNKPAAESGNAATSNKPDQITKPIFGIFLGEPAEQVSKRFKIKKITIQPPDSLIDYWQIFPTPDTTEQLIIGIYNNRVCGIYANFTEVTKENFASIDLKLKQTYKEYPRSKKPKLYGLPNMPYPFKNYKSSSPLNAGIQPKESYPVSCEINNIPIQIGLQLESYKMILWAYYIHKPLLQDRENEITDGKIKKASGQL